VIIPPQIALQVHVQEENALEEDQNVHDCSDDVVLAFLRGFADVWEELWCFRHNLY
jgi:hypothetical protein